MRFDLTHASCRVLERASKRFLPLSPSEISAAKLIIALFEEEECRAANWLSQAGLSLKKFFIDFELYDLADELSREIAGGTAKLQFPISAPGFAAGAYGVPPEIYQGGPYGPMGRRIETDSMQDNYYSSGNTPGRPKNDDEESENADTQGQTDSASQQESFRPPQEPDDWVARQNSEVSVQQRYYSVCPGYSPRTYISNTQTQARFYLDDQTVQFGRLSKELENALEIVAAQFSKRSEARKRVPSFEGGVTTIISHNAEFMASTHPLATEHLLLATAYDEHDVGAWLREYGFEPATLHERIENLEAQKRTQPTSDAALSASTYNLDESEFRPTEKFDGLPKKQNSLSFTTADSQRIYRLVDAAGNRAGEALRVLEDFVRFVLDDSKNTQRLKDFRHKLKEILTPFCSQRRLEARNTVLDVGTDIEGSDEYQRKSVQDVLAANFARLQESLRSLEEFSKLEEPSLARKFEQLRYQSYTLQKTLCCNNTNTDTDQDVSKVAEQSLEKPKTEDFPLFQSEEKTPENAGKLEDAEKKLEGKEKTAPFDPLEKATEEIRVLLDESSEKNPAWENARLYVLLDCRKNEDDFKQIARQLIEGGADIIQLRDKKADDRTLLARAKVLRELLQTTSSEIPGKRVLFIMNDRPDIARLAEADGVHVGQDELSVSDVRKIVGPDFFVGVSTHNIEQARQAVLDGADYIGAGPVFESSTKNVTEIYEQLPGLEFLRKISENIVIPAFAIGGITMENLSEVLRCGMERIAVSAAILNAENPCQATKNFAEQLHSIDSDRESENIESDTAKAETFIESTQPESFS